MLNLLRWDAVPSGGNGLYHSIRCVHQTPFPLMFPTPVPHHQVDQENPQVEPADDPLVQPRKSTWIRHQNQFGNSKVVLCYVQKRLIIPSKALSLFTAPVPTPLSNPWLGKQSHTRNVLKKYSKCTKILVTPEFVVGGEGGGGHGHTQLWNSFFISWWWFFSFFSHENFVKCVFGVQAFQLHTSHSDSQTKIIKFGAFLPPMVVTSK